MNAAMTSAESDTKPLQVTTYACRLRNNLRRYQAKYEAKENNNDPTIWRKRRGYQCDICGHKFHASITLKQHKLAHNGEKLYNCHLCSFSTSMKTLLEAHVEKHAFLKKFFCDLCDYSCIDPAALAQHRRTHGIDRPYKCGLCDYAADSRIRLEEHCTTHTQEKPYSCKICQRSFPTSRGLSSHRFVHMPSTKIKCKFCDYVGASGKGLARHMRTHTKKKPVNKCNLCNHIATTQEHLAAHVRTHTRERPYNCQLCGKNFATKEALYCHIRIHTGEKPYACRWCKFATAHRNSLRRHANVMHKRALPPKIRSKIPKSSDKTTIGRPQKTKDDTHGAKYRQDVQDGIENDTNNDVTKESDDGERHEVSVLEDSRLGIPISKHTKSKHRRRDKKVPAAPAKTVRKNNPITKIPLPQPSFQCDYCGVSVDAAMKLLDHLRHHTGQKLYKCDVSGCDFKSGILIKYKLHQSIHAAGNFQRET